VRPWASRAVALAQRTLATSCHGVVSAAPGQLRALGPLPRRRITMVNYPRFSNFETAEARPQIAADPRLKLMHIGSNGRTRGLFLMLDVMSTLGPDAPVSLYLGGPYADPADEPAVKARVEGELAGRVHLLGRVPPDEVPSYLKAADVCWSPFVGGPQYSLPNVPTKVYEGMAAGLPVLVSDLADHAAPVKAERCGVAVPVTVDGHLAGVRRLLADPEERGTMGRRGLAAVRARYSWEVIEGDLLAFYADLCRGLPADG
jgi:glycosyltransferase involved in cell wall biosynthesis